MTAAGVPIDADDVRRVRERTEGWAAGLRLAAMSLAPHDDPHRVTKKMTLRAERPGDDTGRPLRG
jgi:ATP/maltotriose-dependent transcriptional regulator MalT